MITEANIKTGGKQIMTINIDDESELKQPIFDFDYEQVISDVINEAIDYAKCPYEAEVSVLLVNNSRIQEINKENREIDAATDVLSFPMIEYEKEGDFDFLEENGEDCFEPDTGELLLGDIVISVEKVYEQADKYGHSVKRELAFLTAHSMMHLFGFDHMIPEEAKIMEEHQNNILNNLGITR